MKWLLAGAGLAALVFAADRLFLWLEWRGWIDYRRTNPGRIDAGRVGPAFLGIQALFDPAARHHVEQANAVRTERETSGENDGDGGGDGPGGAPS